MTQDDGRDHEREPAYVTLLRSPHMVKHREFTGGPGVKRFAFEYRCSSPETQNLIDAYLKLRGTHEPIILRPDFDEDGLNYVYFSQYRNYWPPGFPDSLRGGGTALEDVKIVPNRDVHRNNLTINISRVSAVELLRIPPEVKVDFANDAAVDWMKTLKNYSGHPPTSRRAIERLGNFVQVPEGVEEIIEGYVKSDDLATREIAKEALDNIRNREGDSPEMTEVGWAIEAFVEKRNR